MWRSLAIGKAFGIGVYLHWSMLFLPVWVFLSNLHSGWQLAVYWTVFVIAIFGCIVLHEFGHALMARRYGIRTRDITLYPIGGVARLERMIEQPWHEFFIALAGPAVNVAIVMFLLPTVLFFACRFSVRSETAKHHPVWILGPSAGRQRDVGGIQFDPRFSHGWWSGFPRLARDQDGAIDSNRGSRLPSAPA
ncbi:MAG: hypothetical protein KatS3mg105_1236 [Gemmatales bacterium]|nr:MAG: hypothetical protein KatS3mg105_1236 [Gemmatales bacterium]